MVEQPKMDERIRGFKGYGLIHILHGEGKGKTTSALGTAIRCAGSGRRVKIIYFDKGGAGHYSERAILDQIQNIDYTVTGRDRIHSITGRFDFSIQQVDRDEAERGLQIARQDLTTGDYDLVVLDEINSTTDLGMLDVSVVLSVLKSRNKGVEVVLTGRNPAPEFLIEANLISNVGSERHYFYSGVPAREGIDF
ncbi:cob(I)yrinic acid a,c-diamide adenosyltransferase [Candidatus Uhrbacteria bacterium CG_4_10_14_0_2_um_filter_41_7]|uniref:Cob(I)yrinic acid a,c-diamide adenosyltransferase n=1 Tax=Candidatus Uhrbacteria bacterium CG_4_9_14_3_um_filter_41_35 TaxID=1975034 RepID=A0A2M7XFH3_9BACT|nr:MAG: cob(I)yrinic acid a,c-diamide adenosyltransferase [Candidatus Uhrbacteria bacterium CG11_big_fil_rev_8_21_14_0_20_41_9]PIZ55886.1 MAG: cob(I)yrinic acid a,c-diamide adenosyltransferase [Candidatus Uhrbacteria bacterium CG_4_10_14_0_2_um_filter_41_7]PJA46611.1 MAG: cob(I)yrinic acid a,c-diamide adenosyltransferase [Candidatus Uhrbacteria bacterium CG_4_9_14_3_um_filter_41_35]